MIPYIRLHHNLRFYEPFVNNLKPTIVLKNLSFFSNKTNAQYNALRTQNAISYQNYFKDFNTTLGRSNVFNIAVIKRLYHNSSNYVEDDNKWMYKYIKDLCDKMKNHPFLREILVGILPEYKFIYFLLDDIVFLDGVIEIISEFLLSDNLPNDIRGFFERYIKSIKRERNFNKNLLAKHTTEIIENHIPSKACNKYLEFLRETLKTKHLSCIIGTFLVCPWSYSKTFQEIILKKSLDSNKISILWLEEHNVTRISQNVMTGLPILDEYLLEDTPNELAETQQNFLKASKFDLDFMDNAYYLGRIPEQLA